MATLVGTGGKDGIEVVQLDLVDVGSLSLQDLGL